MQRIKNKVTVKFAMVLLAIITLAPMTHAQSEIDWWFDVEFIAFKRDMLPDQAEDFSQSDYDFSETASFDLMTLALLKQNNPHYRLQASMPRCEAKPSDLDQLLSRLFTVAFNPESFTAPLDEALNLFVNNEFETNAIDVNTELEVSGSANDAMLNQGMASVSFDELHIPEPARLSCAPEPEYEMFQQVPTRFFADSDMTVERHHLLASEERYLSDYAKRLFTQRGIQGILYTAWRQPVVFGEDNAKYYKIFGGSKISTKPETVDTLPDDAVIDADAASITIMELENGDKVEGDGISVSDAELQDPILDSLILLQNALETRTMPKLTEDASAVEGDVSDNESSDVWELDGKFKVYLQYVNRVPYLHVDGEFGHHRLALDANGQRNIETYEHKQRRRIISKQVHYFDHPAFGIVIRLERFEFPELPEVPDAIFEQPTAE